MNDFKVGDVVVPVSGGPNMVVTKILRDDDGKLIKVSVMWFGKASGRGQFNVAEGLPAGAFTRAKDAA